MADPEQQAPLVLLYGCPGLSRRLRDRGMAISTIRSLRQLLQPTEDLQARAIVIGPSGLRDARISEVVPQLRERWPMVDVILWSAKATGALVRNALHAGARDVLMTTSPETCAREVAMIVESQQLLPRAPRPEDDRSHHSEFEGMYSRSQRMWDLFDTATRVASTDATVLVLGETGTGKELLARAIHRHSRRDGRFVPVNCGAVNETLVDSELFGHRKGAFTGASSSKEGLFVHAQSGTLFLDEIGNVPLTAQYHLLRALQESSVRPVGGEEEIEVDVRVIAATSSSLEADVQRGKFREDLFYRLDVIRLEIPPLRERPEDIVFLFAHFARNISEEYNVARPDLDDSFLDALVSYEWPGNVRQLENFTERLVLTTTGQRIGADVFERLVPFRNNHEERAGHLPRVVRGPGFDSGGGDSVIDTERTLDETIAPQVASIEKAYLEACLQECNGRIGDTARRAGISRRTLSRKLSQYGLDKSRFRTSNGESPTSP
jgi:DNA-binding NtrC family response regulator